jgi:L-2-aminoadipate reductase
MLPYSSLRAANVLATMDCVRLCTSGKPKSLTFISSTSVLDSEHYICLSQEGGHVLETDDLAGSRKGLATGYGQSKWASEFVVREAGRRGLAGAIVRPGYITGDPASGISVTDDFLVRLLKGCLQVGARPDVGNSLNAVPVTRVARIVVGAAFYMSSTVAEGSLGIAQVTSRPRPTLNDWMGALDAYGYHVPKVSYDQWREKIKSYVGDSSREEHALLPLFHFVVGDLPANTVAPEMDDGMALKVLEVYGDAVGFRAESQTAGTVDAKTLGMYLAYLVGVGFLPPPSTKGTCELPELNGVKLGALANGHLGGRSAKP